MFWKILMSKIQENNVTVLIVRINCYHEVIVDMISTENLIQY